MGSAWDEVPIVEDVSGYTPLPYSPRHFLIAYAAGPRLLCRKPGSLREAIGTPEDIEEDLAEDIMQLHDFALAQADIPGLPPGYRWFIRLPPGAKDGAGLWSLLDESSDLVDRLGGATPESEKAILAAYRDVLRTLYRDGDG